MRGQSHIDSLERWALFIRENPGKWKQIHTEFIDAQFIKSEEFYRRLSRTKEGRQKIREISRTRSRKPYQK